MPRKCNLKENVLYRLEMYHPIIDAVGLFVQDRGIIYLVYFQVSISSYDAHKKKIGDLFADNHNNNKYPETCWNYCNLFLKHLHYVQH